MFDKKDDAKPTPLSSSRLRDNDDGKLGSLTARARESFGFDRKRDDPRPAAPSQASVRDNSRPAEPAVQATAQNQVSVRYIDRPECLETFVDSITGLSFDGQSMRLEFSVTRMDEVKANTQPTGRRYPVARLALPPVAALELISKLQQLAAALAKAGLLKPTQPAQTGQAEADGAKKGATVQ